MKSLNSFNFVRVAISGTIAAVLFCTAAFSQAPPRQEKLLNGMRILMFSKPGAEKVRVKLRIHAGSAFDPQGKEGVMRMLANNLFPNASTKEFFAEDLGGSLDVTTGYDYIEIDATAKSDSLTAVLETLSTAVSNTVIDKETTARLRDGLLKEVTLQEARADYVADQKAAERLLGTFPYGRPIAGTPASLARIQYPDLIDAKQRFLTADNATIAITGDFDRASTLRALKRLFGPWLKSDKLVPSSFTQPDEPKASLLNVASPEPDAFAIRFAVRGAARNGKDFAASAIMASILESRLRSMVPPMHAADVVVQNRAHVQPGYLLIGFGSSKGSLSGQKIEANDLLAKALGNAVSESEFQAARALVQKSWSARDPEVSWLDVDTYQLQSAEADSHLFDNVTIADVRSFAEKLRSRPIVSVLVNTPKTDK